MEFLDFVHLICIHRQTDRDRELCACRHTHNFQHNHCLYSRQMPQWETRTPKSLVNETVSSAWSHSHRNSLLVRPKKTEFYGARSGQYGACSNISHPQCSNHTVVIWHCVVLHGHGAWKHQGWAIPGFLLQRAPLSLSIVLQQYW